MITAINNELSGARRSFGHDSDTVPCIGAHCDLTSSCRDRLSPPRLSDDSRTTGRSSWNYETRERREKARYTQEHVPFFATFACFVVSCPFLTILLRSTITGDPAVQARGCQMPARDATRPIWFGLTGQRSNGQDDVSGGKAPGGSCRSQNPSRRPLPTRCGPPPVPMQPATDRLRCTQCIVHRGIGLFNTVR